MNLAEYERANDGAQALDDAIDLRAEILMAEGLAEADAYRQAEREIEQGEWPEWEPEWI